MLKNFLITLSRFRTSSILNIGGLSFAYIAFIIISLQIIMEYSFDRMYSDSDRIYRVERPSWIDTSKWEISLSRPVIDIIANSSSDIEESAIIKSLYNYGYSSTWRLESTVNEEGLVNTVPVEMSSDFAKMFEMNIIEGELSDNLQKGVMSKSMAKKLAGDKSIVGKVLTDIERQRTITICGVYEDFPETSSFSNDKIYCGISDKELGLYNYMNYTIFVKLRKGADIAALEKIINKEINEQGKALGRNDNYGLRLQNISDIHLAPDMRGYNNNSNIGGPNMQKVRLFGFFALLIMLIASINYINFSMALIPLRIRSVNTRKIFGESVQSLRLHFIGEAVLMSVFAYIIAVLVVFAFGDLSAASFISSRVIVADNISAVGLIGLFAVLLGVLAGVYPAYYSTSFQVAYVLKGSFSLSPKGKMFRMALVGFQFVISIGLIVAAIIMNLQFKMIENRDLGVDKENVIRVNLRGKSSLKAEDLKSRFLGISGVKSVTNTPWCIVGPNYSQYTNVPNEDGTEDKRFYNIHATSNFVDFFGLTLIEGRNFTSYDDQKSANSAILINETAKKTYNLKIGDKIDKISSINGYWVQDKNLEGNTDWEIVGVVKDFNFKPLYEQIAPMMIINYGTSSNNGENTIYIKAMSDDYKALIKSIASIVKEYDLDWMQDVAFLDSTIEELYQSDLRSASLVSWFSLLAILISLAGVFGLVHFEVGHRRKEIGLRKINGATVSQIISMLNSKFLIMTVICYLIAVPFSVYFVKDWLSIFAYRTPIYWWVFVVVLLIVIFVTLLTVLVQSYRTATDNPINSIKTE